jgi:ribosomal protein L37AE/L43A
MPTYGLKLAFMLISYGFLAWAIFRMLSKNVYKRYEENRKYLRFLDRWKDKEHRYYDCPKCKQTVRVPRGKGKISITCPTCKEKFVKKT